MHTYAHNVVGKGATQMLCYITLASRPFLPLAALTDNVSYVSCDLNNASTEPQKV